MKKLFILLIVVLAAAAGVVVSLPSPIDSIAVKVSRPLDFVGALAVNDTLQSTHLIPLPKGKKGGETVARDQLGCLFTGTDDGSILRKCSYTDWETMANTGGRPLGMVIDQQQNLIIADAEKGLLSMSPNGKLSVLVDHYQDKHLGVTDDVDIGADGTIYFSDASNRYPLKDIVLDVLDGRPSGRLFSYKPDTGELTLLADSFAFANGVAVSADQSYVLINETFTYRVSKVWLTGPKAGEKDIILDKLPGMPDGIARADNGTYWVAVYGLRSKVVDKFHDKPWVKNLLAKLPKSLAPVPKPYGFILQIDANGNILQSMHDQAAVAIGEVTSVLPQPDGLYLGTLHMGVIGKLAL